MRKANNHVKQSSLSSVKAHYFAYQLNSKAKHTLATYRCLALVSSNQENNKKAQANAKNVNKTSSERRKREAPEQNHAIHSKTSRNDCLRVRPRQTLHESAREADKKELQNHQGGSLCSSERGKRHHLRVEQRCSKRVRSPCGHHRIRQLQQPHRYRHLRRPTGASYLL